MAPIVGRSMIFVRSGRDGAIAQLGERVVRNDEVGGSIPPGSTSLRRLRLLRLGKPSRSEGCRGEARRAKPGLGKQPPCPPYFPVNLGGRFSIKLATPSRKSLPRSATTISRLASMVASASVWNGTS
jgi:hypothetical protein